MRYEDPIEEPAEVLGSILEFVGEKFERQMLERDFRKTDQSGFGDHKSYQSSGISQQSRKRWTNLSQWMLNRLAELANPTLEKFGYDPMAVAPTLVGWRPPDGVTK